MKLNPKKCTFGVEEGMFLGYMVNTKGKKVCPDKVEAVLSLPSPKCLKDVHRLNEKLASLNRFLAKSEEKSPPFFKTLKKCTKKSDFQWTMEAESVFKQMKKLIAELPTLTTPMEKEELIMYLAAAREAVSAILLTEREAKQMPIYFVSRALQGPEINYTPVEKLVLALVHASKRLKRYFQAHPIVVITDQPIKQVLSKPKIAGRLQKWSIELGEYDIHYRLRVSIKGQILADFIVERPEDDSLAAPMEVKEELPELWTLCTDGSSCVDGSRAGLILTNPEGAEFTYALRFKFNATNNEAEYEALIASLRIAEQMGIKTFKHIFAHLTKQVLVEVLKEKSVNEAEVLTVMEEEGNTWMTPIYEYLTEETFPVEKKKARAVRLKSRRYAVINGVLYKKSFLEPWLRCVGPLQANYVMREIHEGSCNMHAGPRSVVAKAIRTWYYWPTMNKDTRKVIRECQDCQVHSLVPRNPQQKLTPITSTWPFYKWGIDIAGPFPEGLGKRFASVKHSQANGLVERANRSLGEGMKAQLVKGSKDWMEEILHVLWAHGIMIKSSNGDTPFSLTYGTGAVIPAKIGMPTLRTTEIDMVQNDEALKLNLDLLEEKREQTTICEARSKAKMEKYYNSKVRNTSFKPGDLVYRSNDANHTEDGGKLGPKWEGPYEVIEALGKGAYKLKDCNGKLLPRTWNVRNLKKCYIHEM
ncbi:reverse transcriptase domain-containing protein [Tanacetum coccineum]|uniref:Reverse transcriptase domain-containing protein n=1 Tax=Tanacetum coccineum TaxID=301880 RepID=A0ABQ4WYE8_9ASTR